MGKELRYSNFESYVGDPHQKLLIEEGTSVKSFHVCLLFQRRTMTQLLKPRLREKVIRASGIIVSVRFLKLHAFVFWGRFD